jgi:hypothetical protein
MRACRRTTEQGLASHTACPGTFARFEGERLLHTASNPADALVDEHAYLVHWGRARAVAPPGWMRHVIDAVCGRPSERYPERLSPSILSHAMLRIADA